MRYHAEELRYERVRIFEKEAFFTCDRIQEDSVPEGLYQYEVRHDDDGFGNPVQIADEETQGSIYLSEEDWCWTADRSITLDEVLRRETEEHL